MQVRWVPAGRRIGFAEAYAGVALLGVAAAWAWPRLPLAGALACPLYARAGIPCATCGFTRAFTRVAQGELAGAWRASPLGTLVFLAALGWIAWVALRFALAGPWPRVTLARRDRLLLGGGVAVVVLGNWAWILWRHFGVGDWG